MGMIHQPDPEKKPNMFEGILAIRHMHRRVLRETGYSTADEMLYPENLVFVDDLVSYHAVGARSVEDQQHRFPRTEGRRILRQDRDTYRDREGNRHHQYGCACIGQHIPRPNDRACEKHKKSLQQTGYGSGIQQTPKISNIRL